MQQFLYPLTDFLYQHSISPQIFVVSFVLIFGMLCCLPMFYLKKHPLFTLLFMLMGMIAPYYLFHKIDDVYTIIISPNKKVVLTTSFMKNYGDKVTVQYFTYGKRKTSFNNPTIDLNGNDIIQNSSYVTDHEILTSQLDVVCLSNRKKINLKECFSKIKENPVFIQVNKNKKTVSL